MRVTSLVFLMRDDKIVLAMKKQRYGVGKWNGAGGKAEPGETAIQAAIRECEEEIGVTPLDPRYVGRLKFYEKDNPKFGHDCHVFTATEWQGELTETEEMRPQWFKIQDIPYDQMWPDDKIWLPMLLDGKLFAGTATTDANTALVSYDIKTVNRLEKAA